MKTKSPRRWLLSRHESSGPKLDALRHEALTGLAVPVADSTDALGRIRPARSFHPSMLAWIGAGALAASLTGFVLIQNIAGDASAVAPPPSVLFGAPAMPSAKGENQTSTAAPLVPVNPVVVMKEGGKVPAPAAGAPVARTNVDPDSIVGSQVSRSDTTIQPTPSLELRSVYGPFGGARAGGGGGGRGGAIMPLTIGGQVKNPGFGINRPMPLGNAIAAAGGLTEIGSGSAITVTRTQADGAKQVLGPFDLSTDAGKKFMVLPGDTVNVPIRLL